MPAAMVFPTAAAMPNHMPRTWSSRPRPVAGEELTREEGSDVADNVRSRGIREMQPSYRGQKKMQAKWRGEKAFRDQLSVLSKSRRKSVWWGRRWFPSRCKGGVAELLTAARVERIWNATPDAP